VIQGWNLFMWLMKGNHMIPPDLDIDERRAAALPQDWPEDFDQPTTKNVFGDCLRIFVAKPTRIQCKRCSERKTL
jgi:hypothetical protein